MIAALIAAAVADAGTRRAPRRKQRLPAPARRSGS